jgi:hypothetical protein
MVLRERKPKESMVLRERKKVSVVLGERENPKSLWY